MSQSISSETRTRVRPIGLMIVGVPKAGTTSLKEYLGQHPAMRTHEQREMIFFAADRYEQGYENVFPFYFPGEPDGRVLVAKSVATMYSAVALRRLREHNPRVHVVIMLREPVQRAYSDFWFARRHGLEELETFDDAVEREWQREYEPLKGLPATAYLERSRYAAYIEHLMAEFPEDRTHIYLFDEFRRDPRRVCRRIFRLFDGLDPQFGPTVGVRHNPTAVPRSRAVIRLIRRRKPELLKRALYRVLGHGGTRKLKEWLERLNARPAEIPPITPATRDRLRAHFHPYNDRLAELLGRDLGAWNDRSGRG